MSFNFNEVQEVTELVLPELISNDVYRNQQKLIDPLVLKKLHVLCVGVGSIGSNVVYTLNKMGISSFALFDFDIWESHNSASSVYSYKRCEFITNKIKNDFSNNFAYHPMIPLGVEEKDILLLTISPFKVDLLKEEILKNDEQCFFELFRIPFAEPPQSSFAKFNESIKKTGTKCIYNDKGETLLTRYHYLWHYRPIITPDLMILATDNLQSRVKSALYMRELIKKETYKELNKNKPFFVIDTRVFNASKAEILLFDLNNDKEFFDWINYSIIKDKRENSLEEFLLKIDDDLEKVDQLFFFQNDEMIECGNKMSIIISSQLSVIVADIMIRLFDSKTKYRDIDKLFLFNTNSCMPYISSSKRLLIE